MATATARTTADPCGMTTKWQQQQQEQQQILRLRRRMTTKATATKGDRRGNSNN
jgi:transposase